MFLNYDGVTRSRAPRLDRDPSITSDHRFIHHESIFLPLSDDGKTVNMILVYTVYGLRPRRGLGARQFRRAGQIFHTMGNPPAGPVFVASDNRSVR